MFSQFCFCDMVEMKTFWKANVGLGLWKEMLPLPAGDQSMIANQRSSDQKRINVENGKWRWRTSRWRMIVLTRVGHKPLQDQVNVLVRYLCGDVVLWDRGKANSWGAKRHSHHHLPHQKCVTEHLRVPLKSTTPNLLFVSSLPTFYTQSSAAICVNKVQ